jgi:O-antigen/teichoic acid export membrane protein
MNWAAFRKGKQMSDTSSITSIASLPTAVTSASEAKQSHHSLASIVARNAAFVLGAQVMLKILAFLFNVYVVRRLGAVHFGRYSVVIAYVTIFAVFTDLGMAPYSVREMAEDHRRTSWLLPNIIAIRLVLSLVIILIAPLSAHWLGKNQGMVLGIFIASMGQFIYAFQGPLDSVLTARERLDYTAILSIVNQSVFWGLGVLLLVSGMGFIGLIIASLIGVAVVALLSGWVLFRRLGVGRLVLSIQRWPHLLKAALPFGVSSIAYAFMQRFDTVLMSFVLTDAAVGWYNVPYTLINMMLLAAQSIAIAMYPSMVRRHKIEPGSLHTVAFQSIKYLLIICLPIAVGGTVLADRIITFLYTDEFAPSIPVLRLILWALPSLFLLELLGRVADTLHLERSAARINTINTVITVLLNVVLVPTLGLMGAALALVSGRAIRLVQFWLLIGNGRLVGQRWHPLLRVALATGLMGAGVFFLRESNLFLAIGSGAALYVVLLIVLRAVERREWQQLVALVFRRTQRQAYLG